MQKIINELINNSIRGVDTYRFKESTWLIFSDNPRWVVELTDSGTLWFNYKFFVDVLSYVSLTPRDGSQYITEWAKDYFFRPLNEYQTFDSDAIHRENSAVSVVQRGIKKTDTNKVMSNPKLNNLLCPANFIEIYKVVEEGILKTVADDALRLWDIKMVSVKGSIKETKENHFEEWEYVGHIVDEGIKNTYPDMNPNDYDWSDEFKADKVIKDGEKI